jgi:predicted ATPase
MKTNPLLLLAVLASAASLARGQALLMKETVPANTPSQQWSWCRVYADRVEITGETDGTKAVPVKKAVRFDEGVKDAAALQALIAGADRAVPVKWVTTDSGEVRHTAYRADATSIVLKTQGDDEAENPTEAAKILVGFIDRNCSAEADADAATAFPDYLSLSCTFQTPNGSESFQFKPSDGKSEAGSTGTYVARCEAVTAGGAARAACSIIETRTGATLARKVFDPAGGAGITLEAEPSLRLVCRANS